MMKIREIVRNISSKTVSIADNILEKIPVEKRRLYLLAMGGLVFLAISLTLVTIAAHSKTPPAAVMTAGTGIPADELFYPAEPDFLPALLLEREPRGNWTIDDLTPFWQDPLKGHEDEWRETAKAVIDKLMEGVQ